MKKNIDCTRANMHFQLLSIMVSTAYGRITRFDRTVAFFPSFFFVPPSSDLPSKRIENDTFLFHRGHAPHNRLYASLREAGKSTYL